MNRSSQSTTRLDGVALWNAVQAAGLEVASHHSDLYIRDTPENRKLVETHWQGVDASRIAFRSADGTGWWLDIPFAYRPYWQEREQASRKEE